jgi:FeS assembly SUF system regulator
MFRISRLTDYGTMILVYLAGQGDRLCPASDVAQATHIAQPTVRKLLKMLARTGLVNSVRGTDGGYCLAEPPESISAARILNVLEGPVAITECSMEESHCELESLCQVGAAWQKINHAIRGALTDITLADLGHPPRQFPRLQLDLTTSKGTTSKIPAGMDRT